MFKRHVTLRQLEKSLEHEANDVIKVNWWTLGASLALVIPTLGGSLALDVIDDSAVRHTSVSDAWLGDVAKLETVSERGAAFLQSSIGAMGSLSIPQAREFLKIEKLAEQARHDRAAADAKRSTVGIAALRARLDQAGA